MDRRRQQFGKTLTRGKEISFVMDTPFSLAPEMLPDVRREVAALLRMNRPENAFRICQPEAVDLFEWLMAVDQETRIEV